MGRQLATRSSPWVCIAAVKESARTPLLSLRARRKVRANVFRTMLTVFLISTVLLAICVNGSDQGEGTVRQRTKSDETQQSWGPWDLVKTIAAGIFRSKAEDSPSEDYDEVPLTPAEWKAAQKENDKRA